MRRIRRRSAGQPRNLALAHCHAGMGWSPAIGACPWDVAGQRLHCPFFRQTDRHVGHGFRTGRKTERVGHTVCRVNGWTFGSFNFSRIYCLGAMFSTEIGARYFVNFCWIGGGVATVTNRSHDMPDTLELIALEMPDGVGLCRHHYGIEYRPTEIDPEYQSRHSWREICVCG